MSDEIKDDEKEIKPKKPAKVEAVEKPAEDFGGLVLARLDENGKVVEFGKVAAS